jgi:hypothetical protein
LVEHKVWQTTILRIHRGDRGLRRLPLPSNIRRRSRHCPVCLLGVMSIDVRIARQFKLLAEELLSPSPVLSPADLGVATDLNAASLTVGQARKIAKRPRSRSLKRAIDAALKAGASVVIAPDETVTINASTAGNNNAETSNDVLNANDELARWRRKKNAR